MWARLLVVLAGLALAATAIAPPNASAGQQFADDFESGDFRAWTSVTRLGDGAAVVQSEVVRSGAMAARLSASTSGSAAYARATLPETASDLLVVAEVQVVTEGPSGANVPLLRLFSQEGTRLVSVYRQNQDRNRVYVQHSGAYHSTTGYLPLSTWARLEVRAVSSGVLAVQLDGTEIYRTSTAALSAGLSTLQIGNDTKSQPFTVVVDDVSATTDPDVVASPSPSPSPSASDAVLVGAGDIAMCNRDGDSKTAALLDTVPGTIFTLGDNVYDGTASLTDYQNCYEPTWGADGKRERTRPALGNHEYDAGHADGHFAYFGASAGPSPQGWYSYDLGGWRVIVLNSNCSYVGGCAAGSTQLDWLQQELAASTADCTLAYMHHPLFSSGEHGGDAAMKPFWDALHAAGAEVVLAAHDHHYERFAPQSPSGARDDLYGVREFVVGTGGAPLYPLGAPQPNSEVLRGDTHGVLKLTLHPTSYDWEFLPVSGSTFTDSGTGSCHGAPDTTASPSPSPSPVEETGFTDGFESGGFDAWTKLYSANGGTAEVQTTVVRSGSYAARLAATSTSGSKAYARKSLGGAVADVTVGAAVQVVQEGGSGANVPLLRLYDSGGSRLVSVYRQNQSRDRIYVQHSGTWSGTSGYAPLGTWVAVEVRATSAGLLELRVNGSLVFRTETASLGTGVATVQIGNDTGAQVFTVVVDDVAAGATPAGTG